MGVRDPVVRSEGGERFVSREGLWAAVREGRVNIDSRAFFIDSWTVATVREILKAEGERGALATLSGQAAMAAAMAALPVAFAVNIDAALPGVPFTAAYPIAQPFYATPFTDPRVPAHPIA